MVSRENQAVSPKHDADKKPRETAACVHDVCGCCALGSSLLFFVNPLLRFYGSRFASQRELTHFVRPTVLRRTRRFRRR